MAATTPAQRPESWPLPRSGNARQASANARIGDAQPARDESVGWPSWYDGKHINEVLFCHDFLTRHPMRCVNGTLFTVDGPVINEELVKHQIVAAIQDCITTGLSKRAASLLEAVKIQAYAEPFPVEHDRIHCANGIYHLNGTFEPIKVFCANRLAVSYNPAAASPQRWLTFLSELLEADDIPTLQEYMGYCLIPSTKAQKMMLIIGKGGEGKSRIGLVLSALPKTNYIKSIVTAEAKMDLERKGIQSYQQQLYARFLCFGKGALTSLYDHSDGFYRRQLILTTKDKPADRRDDPFLVEKLLGELEGILLWCLEGLHRLLANDYRFTVSQRAAANVETIKRSSNNVLEFLQSEGYIAFDPAAQASSKALYASYKMWCADNAVHCLSASRFSSELTQNEQRYGIHATNNIYLPNSKRVRGFTGVKVLFHSLNFS